MESLLSVQDVIPPGSRVVVAVSGGRDSKALLHALVNLGVYNLILAHVNHGLRKNAWRDQLFVAALAKKYGVDIEMLETDIKEYAKEYKLSKEEAGREVRYTFFTKVARKHNSSYVVTAHTKDDQAETVIGHIVRGCLLDGLGGMEELATLSPASGNQQPVFLYRPLLRVSRETINSYVKYNNLSYVEDETNSDTSFRRNYIRHIIIPQLKKVNPQVANKIAENTECYRDLEDYVSRLAHNWLDKEENEFSVLAFNQEHVALRREIVRQLLTRFLGLKSHISSARIEGCVNFLMYGNTGSCFPLNKDHQLRIEYGNLHIRPVIAVSKSNNGASGAVVSKSKKNDKQKRFKLNSNGETSIGKKKLIITRRPSEGFSLGQDKLASRLCAFIDGEALAGQKLYLRFWQPGDKFVPLGMHGQKKLQDFFVDLKVSQRERNKIPLIVTESDEIVWVVGYRLDDRFKLANKSKEVVEISWGKCDKR